MKRRDWHILLVTVIAVVASAALMCVLEGHGTVRADAASAVVADPPGESFVYAFDPDAEAFPFTFALPVKDANPRDVLAIRTAERTDVWFTESGADRIGRLIYTATSEYLYEPYGLPAGSKPLSLIASDDVIWFTAPGADAVGRLDPSTGDVEMFEVGAGTYPADLAVGPNGHIWFTQMMADQLAELVITSTTDYAVNVYTDSPLSGGRPRGIAFTGRSIYLAQTANDLISIFTPPADWIHMPVYFPITLDEPYALTVDGRGRVWGTERAGNVLGRYGYGTFPDITQYELSPGGSQPTDIAAGPDDSLWFTQYAAGQIGRLDQATKQFAYYLLPQPDLAPAGISVGSEGHVWVVASRPHQVHLPLVIRN